MKAYQIILASIFLAFALLFSPKASAQQAPKQAKFLKTEFRVEGVCMMCKKRIEAAVDISGVKLAQWNKQSKILTVIYKPNKVTEESLHAQLAHAGHRTEQAEADPTVYEDLPFCCQYDDGAVTH